MLEPPVRLHGLQPMLSDYVSVLVQPLCTPTLRHDAPWSDAQFRRVLVGHPRVRGVHRDRALRRTPLAADAGRQALFFGSGVHASSYHSAAVLWSHGLRGAGVRVAIFDSGLSAGHEASFEHDVERTNWTDEPTTDDVLGHGTFVCGVVASRDSECPGFAPEAELLAFRVFTRAQLSYTSWFMDAFNFALQRDVDVLNLSVGGPDFLDQPFVDKVNELSANGVIVVSAIGNDGPLAGTLNNPGDQLDVIGVGGVDAEDGVAPFSSRGMTTWELPRGYGRVKPDVLAASVSVLGLGMRGGCRALTGTSVASPVVAGAVALLLSLEPDRARRRVWLNPASVRQALVESASALPRAHIFEQGLGVLNLPGAYEILRSYRPRASALPARLDLTDCPFMWPLCAQPLYASALPLIANVTLLNGMGVYGELADEPSWAPAANGDWLDVRFTHSTALWPWTGHLSVFVTVRPAAAQARGVAQGEIAVRVMSLVGGDVLSTLIVIPLRVAVVPTPPRARRLLWDQFHNVRYPSGFVPRDSLTLAGNMLDWNGDHLHTNFADFFRHLLAAGYAVEVLGQPLTCVDLSLYGVLLLVDSEEEFYAAEVQAVAQAVRTGLSLLVAADWFDSDLGAGLSFFDENTRMRWHPITGGANVPALGDLLAPFGFGFGSIVWRGEVRLAGSEQRCLFNSGTHVLAAPAGARLASFALRSESTRNKGTQLRVPVLGLLQTPHSGGGRVVVFGDASSFDSAQGAPPDGLWLADMLLDYACTGAIADALAGALDAPLNAPYRDSSFPTPERDAQSDFAFFSHVVGQPLVCSDSNDATHSHGKMIDELLAAHEFFLNRAPGDVRPGGADGLAGEWGRRTGGHSFGFEPASPPSTSWPSHETELGAMVVLLLGCLGAFALRKVCSCSGLCGRRVAAAQSRDLSD